MHILIAHNAYQQRGGEDEVVESEIKLLRRHGHTVSLFHRHNDETANMSHGSLLINTLWSSQVHAELQTLLANLQPDIIHVHNTFPLISPSLYWVAAKTHTPVVQTLHNFRLLCPQAMFLRKNQVCLDCLGRFPWLGVARACYRDSRSQTAVLAGMLGIHRLLGTWQHKVTRFIALNEFCRDKFIQGGLPAEKILIKPNFVDFRDELFSTPTPGNERGGRQGFIFVGRLSEEKGLSVLLQAAGLIGESIALRVAGSGPQTNSLQGMPGVTALGMLEATGIRREMCKSLALVLPSICYESFPRTLVEAYASGLPVIASRLGALSELVHDGETGLLFEPGNAEDLAAKLRWARDNPDKMAKMGQNARQQYEAEFSADKNYSMLLAIYQEAINAT